MPYKRVKNFYGNKNMSNNQYPSLIFVEEINNDNPTTLRKDPVSGKDIWVKARGIGPTGLINRIKLTWGVFTGKYDALVWYDEFIKNETKEQNELNNYL